MMIEKYVKYKKMYLDLKGGTILVLNKASKQTKKHELIYINEKYSFRLDKTQKIVIYDGDIKLNDNDSNEILYRYRDVSPEKIAMDDNNFKKNKNGTFTANKIIDLVKSSNKKNIGISSDLIDFYDDEFILDKCIIDPSYGRKKFIENYSTNANKEIFNCYEIPKTYTNFSIIDEDEETYTRNNK